MTFQNPSKLKKTSRSSLYKSLILLSLISCRPASDSQVKDRSQDWADEKVTFQQITDPMSLVLRRQSVDQTLNSARYYLFAIRTADGVDGDRFQVFYTDWSDADKTTTETLTHRIELERLGEQFFVYFRLFKPSLSSEFAPKVQFSETSDTRVFIGTATFQNEYALISPASTQPFKFLRLSSENEDFIGNHQVGVTYIQSPQFNTYPRHKCINGEQEVCLSLEPSFFCDGKISKPECIPPKPLSEELEAFQQSTSQVQGALALSIGSYLLQAELTNPSPKAIVNFVSKTIKSDAQNNQQLCQEQLKVLRASSVDGRENPSCLLKLLPSNRPQNENLTCQIEVSFTNPLDVADQSCNLSAIFKSTQGTEIQSLQLLYEPQQ